MGLEEKVFVLAKIYERGAAMVFKDKLKEKRVEAGLSQVELAAKVGVSSRTIQNYELGQRRPAVGGAEPGVRLQRE